MLAIHVHGMRSEWRFQSSAHFSHTEEMGRTKDREIPN